ncbi:hypothetical protein DMN91_005901, partial [Ooceraea biroi]
EEQRGKQQVDELTSLTVSQVISNEAEDVLIKAEFPAEKTAEPSMLGRDIAETTMVITMTSTEELIPDKEAEKHKGKPQFEGLTTVVVTEIASNEIEDTLPEAIAPKEQQAQPSLTGREVAETMQIITSNTTEDFAKAAKLDEQKGKPGIEELSSVTVSEIISNEVEDVLFSKAAPTDHTADFSISGREIAETTQVTTMSETSDLITEGPEEQRGKQQVDELTSLTVSQVISNEAEDVLIKAEFPAEKTAEPSMLGRDIAETTMVITMTSAEELIPDKEAEKHKGKPQFEGLTTVVVTEIASNEIEDTLPEAIAPKEQQAQPSLTGREVAETMQIITSNTTEDFAKAAKLDEQKGKPGIEELSSVTVSEIISNEVEDVLFSKAAPTDHTADFSISGREIAETTQVTTMSETSDLITEGPEEQRGKQQVDELTSLTVSQVISNEAEDVLIKAEFPAEKTAEPSMLGRDIAETTMVITMTSAEELIPDKEAEKHKGKPQFEGLTTVVVTEIASNEIEDTLPEAIAPKEQQAQPSLTGREVAETMQIITSNTTEDFAKAAKLDEQKGKPGIEELSSVTVSEIISNEVEDVLFSKAAPTDHTADFSISGREIAETTQVTTMSETSDLVTEGPEEQRGKQQVDELTSLTVSQVISNEAEDVLIKAEFPAEKTAEPSMLGRDIAETTMVITMTSAEELIPDKEAEKHKGKPQFEGLTTVVVTEIASNEIEDTLPEAIAPKEQQAQPSLTGREVAETMQIITSNTTEDFAKAAKLDEQKGKPGIEELSSVTVSEIISNEVEDVLFSKAAPTDHTADFSISGREIAETTQVTTMSETSDLVTEGPEEQRGKQQVDELTSLTVSQVISNEAEDVLIKAEFPAEKTAEPSMLGRDIAETTMVITMTSTEELIPDKEAEKHKGKPQFEGLTTVVVTEIASNEIEDTLPEAIAPKEQQAQPSLTGREVAETMQIITSNTTEDFAKAAKLDEQKGKPGIEELSSVTVSEIISNEVEDVLFSKAAPTDHTADFSISGREIAETTQVTTMSETSDLVTEGPEEQRGKQQVDELTSLTVSQVISNEAEDVLIKAEFPAEKTAEPSMLGRDVAETMLVLTMSSTDEFMPQKETAKQQGKPCLEELTSLTVSQIISQEAEDVLPSPQVPSEKTAQTSLYGRDVAEITEVTTVSNVDELIEIQKPEIQKGKPNLEELLSLSVTQTVFNETEALLPSPEMPRETMAQTDISGRDVAETSQILTMLSVEELAKQLTPDKRAGQFKIEELSSLTVSQVLSHETEETFQSSDAPSGLTAMPMMSGREIAEISQVLTVTIAEEFSKPKSPEGQRVKPRLDELSSLMVSQVISTELEQQLPSPEKIDEKTAAPSLLGREIAEKTEIITAASVEQIPEFKKTEGEKGRPDVEEMSFITVSEVLSTEAEQELPSQEAPKEYKALSKVSSIEVAETSEILTVSNVEEFVKSQAPEEHKGRPNLEELLPLSVSEVAYTEAEKGLLTPEQPTKQIAEQSMLGIRVAEKSQVITSSTTKEIIESVQPEIQKIIPEQIPYESIQQIQSVPHESERSLLPDKAAPSATAEVSFRISEGLEVIQVTATEKEAKEVVKGQAKEASAQADIVDRKVALKTEILPENVVSEFVISKPEGKIAHGVKDERQGVIVTEIQHTAEIESNLPETVIPLAKLASTSIEADHLEKIVDTLKKSLYQ